jgi:hypothetical protein
VEDIWLRTHPLLRSVAWAITFAAYLALWGLTDLPNPLSSRNYALLVLKLFSAIGLLVCANFMVSWCARRVKYLREKSRGDA